MFQKSTLFVFVMALALFFAPSGSAATCATDTLADYIANGSCTLGDLSFTNITGSASSTMSDLGTSQIQVTAITIPNDPGLQFNHGFDAIGSERVQNMTVSFTVTDTASSLIDDIGPLLNAGATGKGSVTFQETYCNIAFANLKGFSSSGCGVFSVTNPSGSLAPLTLPTAVSSLTITEQLSFNSHGIGASDTKDSAFGSFGGSVFDPIQPGPGNLSPVPEPRSVSLLLGLGLVAGLIVAKRFQAARS